jgi:hypothetical protein
VVGKGTAGTTTGGLAALLLGGFEGAFFSLTKKAGTLGGAGRVSSLGGRALTGCATGGFARCFIWAKPLAVRA